MRRFTLSCSAWYSDVAPVFCRGMTSVNCGYGRSSWARLTCGATRMPLFTIPKKGLGTS